MKDYLSGNVSPAGTGAGQKAYIQEVQDKNARPANFRNFSNKGEGKTSPYLNPDKYK